MRRKSKWPFCDSPEVRPDTYFRLLKTRGLPFVYRDPRRESIGCVGHAELESSAGEMGPLHSLFASISDILDSSSFSTSTSFQKNPTTPISHASSPGTWTESACFYHELGKCIGIVTSFSASYLRQSILLSSHETPETRSLFKSDLKNTVSRTGT